MRPRVEGPAAPGLGAGKPKLAGTTAGRRVGEAPATASRAPDQRGRQTRAGEGLEAERCGVHVSEKPLLLSEDGPRSAAGRGAVHHASPSDRPAGVRKPMAATPGAGVSAVAPASFRHQRSQAGEEPSERTPWEECIQRRIHAFFANKSFIAERPDECSNCQRIFSHMSKLIQQQEVYTRESFFEFTE